MSPMQPAKRRSRRPIDIVWTATVVVLAGVAAMGLAAATATPAAAKAAKDTVKLVAHQGLGKILVNNAGMTVYIFTADHPNQATCSGGCASVWPPLTVPQGTKPVGGPGVKNLGTIGSGKSRQVTWDKHPLYLYALDTGPGVVNGNGVKEGSFIWYAATSKRVGAAWPSSASSTSSSSPPPTGYGY
jgi:predicted lipoprotein with Yx(FWY)xxD motif